MTVVKETKDHDGQHNDEYARQVGERIVQARKEAGNLTQVELAELVGSSQRAMQGYENGERVPYRQMAEIARIVNKPMAWLLHGDQAILDRDEQTALIDERLKELTKAVHEMSKIVKRLASKIE